MMTESGIGNPLLHKTLLTWLEMLLLVSKTWKATFVSHFGTELDADTKREAENKALAWLQNEYGHDLARATEFDVELVEE